MKRLSVLLALLLLASPALAAVRIIVQPDGNKAAIIKYETDTEKVRAFALDIRASQGKITGISDFIRGESTAANPGYGIFPGSFGRYITVDANSGEVTDWNANSYTPIADPCDPGALGGLGTGGVTIEMGALYYPTGDNSPNAPGNSGLLCKLTLSEPASVTVTLNQIRGGIVLTNPSVAATVDLSKAAGVSIASSVDAPAQSSLDYVEWVAVGKPVCWTYPRQCRGDADGRMEAAPDGGMSYVGPADLNALVAAWQVLEPPFGPGIASIPNGICADFAHDKGGTAATGFYRVGTTDLNRLVANWLVKEPPAGPGIPADCGVALKP